MRKTYRNPVKYNREVVIDRAVQARELERVDKQLERESRDQEAGILIGGAKKMGLASLYGALVAAFSYATQFYGGAQETAYLGMGVGALACVALGLVALKDWKNAVDLWRQSDETQAQPTPAGPAI